jgi:hypothetical protein
MIFTWPDPIGLVADVVTIFGIPAVYVSTRQFYREAKKAREPQSVSQGCLEFNDTDQDVGINLVPLKDVTAIPRAGDRVYLPGETRGSENRGGGLYEVLDVRFSYVQAPEVDQPCPALPSKIMVQVRDLRDR